MNIDSKGFKYLWVMIWLHPGFDSDSHKHTTPANGYTSCWASQA